MKLSPFNPTHPTLKKCKCGLILTRSKLYKHFTKLKGPDFFANHGEVPLNMDDPALVALNNSNGQPTL